MTEFEPKVGDTVFWSEAGNHKRTYHTGVITKAGKASFTVGTSFPTKFTKSKYNGWREVGGGWRAGELITEALYLERTNQQEADQAARGRARVANDAANDLVKRLGYVRGTINDEEREVLRELARKITAAVEVL